MAFHGILAICNLASKDVLDRGFIAVWEWADTEMFGSPLSDDEGATATHYCFNDGAVEPEMANAWQAVNDGVWPAPVSGAWGENGLPTEAQLIAASAPANLHIVHMSGDMDRPAVISATLQSLGLVGYDPLGD